MRTRVIILLLAMFAVAGVQASGSSMRQTQDVRGLRHTMRGYKAFVEAGMSWSVIDDSSELQPMLHQHGQKLSILTIHGYQITNHWFVGGGVGFERYFKPESTDIPIFADVRANFLNDKKIIPYADVKLGLVAHTEQCYWFFEPQIGLRFKTTGKQAVYVAVNFTYVQGDIFGDCRVIDRSNYRVGFKLGYEF